VALLASAASAVVLELVDPAVRGHPVVVAWIAALVLADLILLAGWQASSHGVWRELRKPDEPPHP